MSRIVSSTLALRAAPEDRAAAREAAREQVEKMSEAMIEEKGLLNHAQAALLLDMSTKRVGELVRRGKLTDFTFLGRKYVSMREVCGRSEQDLKAGRPLRDNAAIPWAVESGFEDEWPRVAWRVCRIVFQETTRSGERETARRIQEEMARNPGNEKK